MIKLVLILVVVNSSTHVMHETHVSLTGYATCEDIKLEYNNKVSDVIRELEYNKLKLIHISCR